MAVFKPENVEDFYEIGEVLGGHFGQVRKVKERTSGSLWAGKFLKIRRSACSRLGLDRSSVEHEVEILQAIQHPNIVALKDVFESRAEVVLILELVVSGGELFDFIAEKENLLESEAIEFMKQILEGLKFMHSKNIAHFDLKPENIMLSDKVSHPNIKLIDFGLAHLFNQGEEYRSTSGTPQYIPEVISCQPLSTAADSIGVITYIGLSPFQGDTDEETLKNIIAMKYEFDAHYFNLTSSMAKDFIQKLLVKNPDRMTAEECLLHPWIKVARRNRSSINMRNFKRFNARRKWKMSYNMVWACNRLVNLRLLCKNSSDPDPLQRQCESDVEDTESKPASLLRRRLSSS
uniref:Si:dkey-240h12.4 n=1 Tax=Amphilophus citrinellus TaxID=61819 RepID=A0A3Q0R1V7_AMPCI